MSEADLLFPLLQLNPPILVRADGSPGVVDLAALRRAGNSSGGSSSPAASPHTTSRAAPFASLAARRLQDAKSTARQVSRGSDAATAPPRVQTTDVPGRRKGSLGLPKGNHAAATNGGQKSGKGFAGTASTRTADQHLSGAADSAPTSPAAAAAAGNGSSLHRKGKTVAATTGTCGSTNGSAGNGSHVMAAAAAAAASPGGQQVSLDLPYLMRHVKDTGALLDTLFPLQLPAAATAAGGGSNCADGVAEGALVAVQTVSAAPASREEVMQLHATLQSRLEVRRARPTGLCPIRRSIYTDLFSELVRQVTVEEPVRGLLLARVRENEEHALHVHAALLCEGENFAASKLLQSTENIAMLTEKLSALQQEKVQLEVRKHDLTVARQELEQRFEEQRQARRAQQQDELNYLRRANQQLSLRLKMETERASAGGAVGRGAEDNTAAAAASATTVAAST